MSIASADLVEVRTFRSSLEVGDVPESKDEDTTSPSRNKKSEHFVTVEMNITSHDHLVSIGMI